MIFEKTIKRAKWHLKELTKTFSNEPSFYSSKRIERAIIFINATVMFDLIVWNLVEEKKLDEMGAIGVYAAQMAYAGFQTTKMMQEKRESPKPSSNEGAQS